MTSLSLVTTQSGADVSLGGSYLGFGASLGVNIDSFRSSDSYSQSFGSHRVTLQVGSEEMPEPISVDLVSIDTALQVKSERTTGSLGDFCCCCCCCCYLLFVVVVVVVVVVGGVGVVVVVVSGCRILSWTDMPVVKGNDRQSGWQSRTAVHHRWLASRKI